MVVPLMTRRFLADGSFKGVRLSLLCMATTLAILGLGCDRDSTSTSGQTLRIAVNPWPGYSPATDPASLDRFIGVYIL